MRCRRVIERFSPGNRVAITMGIRPLRTVVVVGGPVEVLLLWVGRTTLHVGRLRFGLEHEGGDGGVVQRCYPQIHRRLARRPIHDFMSEILRTRR